MDAEKLIASTGVRVASAGFVALCVATFEARPGVAAVAGLLAAFGLILSFRAGYDAWMRIAARMQTVVTTVLFGACYLLIVPLFALFAWWSDPLRLRLRKGESSWVAARPEARDLRSYQRMG